MYNAKAYSADSATSPLARTTIARRDRTRRADRHPVLRCLSLRIGSTGHYDPDALTALLKAYDKWDTVMMPTTA